MSTEPYTFNVSVDGQTFGITGQHTLGPPEQITFALPEAVAQASWPDKTINMRMPVLFDPPVDPPPVTTTDWPGEIAAMHPIEGTKGKGPKPKCFFCKTTYAGPPVEESRNHTATCLWMEAKRVSQ